MAETSSFAASGPDTEPSLSILARVIPLATFEGKGDRLAWEDGAVVFEIGDNSLSLASRPRLSAKRKGPAGIWKETERGVDALLSAWRELEPCKTPSLDPFEALRGTRKRWRGGDSDASLFWPWWLFLDSLPREWLLSAARFTARRWHILKLFEGDERFLELAGSNPGLAFALACAWALKPVAMSASVPQLPPDLASWKRRDLASWLGFPATEAAVRALGKIEPARLSLGLLRRLRKILADATKRPVVSRLPGLSPSSIEILAEPDWKLLATESFLKSRALAESLAMIRWVKRAARLDPGLRSILPAASPSRLEAAFASIKRREVRRRWETRAREQGRFFGPSPCPGNDDIIPICCEGELFQEGLDMDNCIPEYLREALAGLVYFYRVLSPLRGTLLIRRDCGSEAATWLPVEVRDAANQLVEPALASELFRWLLGLESVQDGL